MTEGNQDAIRQARLVSNPGCYPTAALLALEPLAAAGLLDGAVYVDAKSGISGAGKTPSDRTHFSENHGSVAAYAGLLTSAHRGDRAGARATGHVRPAPRAARPWHPRDDLRITDAGHDRATGRRRARRRIRTPRSFRLTGGALPEIKHVVHTNFCDIGWKVDAERGRIVLWR